MGCPFPSFLMAIVTLRDLMLHELKDLYDVEHRLKDALSELAELATSDDLKDSLAEHRELTQTQIERLEEVFGLLGVPAERRDCRAMQAILKEGLETVDEAESSDARDAAIVVGARKAEHYEIAGYGTATTFATMLELDDIADLLQQSFDEEEETERSLLELVEDVIDPMIEE